MTYDPIGKDRTARITTNNGRRMFYEVGRLPFEGDCVQHWSLHLGQQFVYDTSSKDSLPWMERVVELWNAAEAATPAPVASSPVGGGQQ